MAQHSIQVQGERWETPHTGIHSEVHGESSSCGCRPNLQILQPKAQQTTKEPPKNIICYFSQRRLSHVPRECSRSGRLPPLQQPETMWLHVAFEAHLCFVCLQPRHVTRECSQKTKCKVLMWGRMHSSALQGRLGEIQGWQPEEERM